MLALNKGMRTIGNSHIIMSLLALDPTVLISTLTCFSSGYCTNLCNHKRYSKMVAQKLQLYSLYMMLKVRKKGFWTITRKSLIEKKLKLSVKNKMTSLHM